MTRLDLFIGREGLVCFSGLKKLLHYSAIDITAQGLPVRLVRATNLGAFIPVETKPLERIDDSLIAFFRITLRVGVLNTEDELSASMPSVCPVKEGGTNHPHVRGTSGGRTEANTNVLCSHSLRLVAFTSRLEDGATTEHLSS